MGREFENQMFSQLQKICGMRGSHTTPYHPQGNGQVERFNRTLLSMLRTLTDDEKADWKSSLAKIVHAYNCTRSEATGFSPYYLLFGRSPRLPVDILFNLPSKEQQVSYTEYVAKWQSQMKEAYEIASAAAQKEASRGKRYYDHKTYGAQLHPGNRVLLRNLRERGGPGKLRSHWEDTVYVVVSQKSPDMPVYEIKPERGDKSRTVHRNLLLPCDSLPVEKPERKGREKSKKRRRQNKGEDQQQLQQQGTDVESEEEGELVWRLPQQHNNDGRVTAPTPGVEAWKQQVGELQERGSEPDVEEAELELQITQDHHDQQEQHKEHTSDEEEHQHQGNRDSDIEQWSSPLTVHTHPQRERRQPRMLTYDTLGQPTVRQAGMGCIEMGKTAPCFQRLWRPWVLMDANKGLETMVN
ncbi:uncharacterized protein LOC130172928 [Seriola aureovittata]|uniref:uncharacterized protein LOC130172928 n=1 Tax=Seriola aureovittata TaxID=2871759 RepID=UPI0024BDBE05|nr:uncharacterized protein LOC130172928 [Seriola aureovittata]